MSRGASGFSLVEVFLALVLMGIGVLAAVPLFVYGARNAASSADFGKVGAAAVQKMERLREASFNSLAAGGSLGSNVAPYFDATVPGVTLRWTIADNAAPAMVKTINVIAIATRAVNGPPKRIQLVTKRSK